MDTYTNDPQTARIPDIVHAARVLDHRKAKLAAAKTAWEAAKEDAAHDLPGAEIAAIYLGEAYEAARAEYLAAKRLLAELAMDHNAQQNRLRTKTLRGTDTGMGILGYSPVTLPVTVTAHLRDGMWDLSFGCPWCFAATGFLQQHYHGGGPLTGEPILGNRVSHCRAHGAPDRYELVSG